MSGGFSPPRFCGVGAFQPFLSGRTEISPGLKTENKEGAKNNRGVVFASCHRLTVAR